MSAIIKLPSGEAIKASVIIAVRKGDSEISNQGTSREFHHKPRVIIDFILNNGPFASSNSCVEDCDSPESRDALAARVIDEWEAELKRTGSP